MSTITRTIVRSVTTTVTSATSTSTARAPAQGGILEGSNPSEYNASSPLILFIIQAGIILIFCRILHYPLSLLRQPRVIAEVIGGILLGPSVMGRIPGFTDAIFPTESIPNLTLVANLGLVLFLFIVGLEVDLRYFVSNWRLAVSVGVAGMALPFGLGCAISWGLYNQFRDDSGIVPIEFGTYMLFIGIAFSITAFPVLCRILTELKLLSTSVGIIVLSAGVGNDVVGWVLLALCVALVNAGSGITALWVILTCVGYAIFLACAVRPAFMWILRRTRSLQDGPSQGVMVLTLLMALSSAFFTGVIGVHPIFGAFLAGLICPHEGGFAIKVTEKIEDLVGALFLPLYFTLSGLSTNLGLLNDGITWAYVVAVVFTAYFAKFAACSLAARLNGLVWRESFTIGSLMSCKGLVELIVLNIGLSAKILSSRVFTIFVVMALVTTFATTPLTSALYPPWYQRKLEAWKRGEIDWDSGATLRADSVGSIDLAQQKLESSNINNLLVYLRLESMPTLLAFVSLLAPKDNEVAARRHPSHRSTEVNKDEMTAKERRRPLEVHGVRLMSLTERNSSVMKVSETNEFAVFDPVLNAFRVLGQLYNFAVSGEVSIIPESSYAESLTTRASEESTDLLILPWSEDGSMGEVQTLSRDHARPKNAPDPYSTFVSQVLASAQVNCAVFVNRGFSGSLQQRPSALTRTMSISSTRGHRDRLPELPNPDRSHHLFMPFFGGPDDRAALRLVVQLLQNPEITATAVHYPSTSEERPRKESVRPKDCHPGSTSFDEDDGAFFASMEHSLPADAQQRVVFDIIASSSTTVDVIARAREEVSRSPNNRGALIVVGRNAQQSPTTSCLGAVADLLLSSSVEASLLVVQA